MSIVANYKRNERYYYVSKATLAVLFLGLPVPKVNAYTERPKIHPKQYHRVRMEIVWTKAEAKAMNRERAKNLAKLRETSFREKLAASVAKERK